MRIVKTCTGKIYVDKDKKLEFLTVGGYGEENNIKTSFLGLNKEINGVRHHAVDLVNKRVATISTQKGYPTNCQFCDCPRYRLHGNVSCEELVYEIRTILASERVTHTNRFNVHFARAGEPTFNSAILLFVEFDLKLLVNQLTTADVIHLIVSTMFSKVNVNLKSFIMEWCRIKDSVHSGEAGLQLSINSTDQVQHNEQSNGKSLSLSEISSLAPKLSMPVGRKYTLNFVVTVGTILNAVELGKSFDREKFIAKITSIHQTNAAIKNGFDVTTEYTDHDAYREFEDPFVATGWDIIAFVPSEEENSDRITCGNVLTSDKWGAGRISTIKILQEEFWI